jgi:hypothetical protein
LTDRRKNREKENNTVKVIKCIEKGKEQERSENKKTAKGRSDEIPARQHEVAQQLPVTDRNYVNMPLSPPTPC